MRPALPPVSVACRHCKQTFQAYAYAVRLGKARYCSVECARAARRANIAPYVPPVPRAKPPPNRRCLKCRAMFASEGPQNRICDACKRSEAWVGEPCAHATPGLLVR